MDMREAVAVAKKYVNGLFGDEPVLQVRLEEFFYDDHLGVWSLTIGFKPPGHSQQALTPAPQDRDYKIVRVSEADKTIISTSDLTRRGA